MLPYATPAIAAELDIWEERERDTLRSTVRQQLGSPARAGARIALAICEVEAGLRSPLQLEELCHWTVWPKLSKRLRRPGGPAVPVGSLVRVVAQEHVPGLAEVLVLVCPGRAGGADGDAAGWAKGRWELVELQYYGRQGPGTGRAGMACARPRPCRLAQIYPQTLSAGLSARPG